MLVRRRRSYCQKIILLWITLLFKILNISKVRTSTIFFNESGDIIFNYRTSFYDKNTAKSPNDASSISRDFLVADLKMNRAKESDPYEVLMQKTNALFVDDDLASAFKESDYPKFCPKDLVTKMASIEKNSTICTRDIRFLVKFYLHITSDTRLSKTTEGYAESQFLMKKYRVERKARVNNITLHRIAATFPIMGVTLLRQYQIERKFSTSMLKEMHADKFPWCMRTQMCLSLAPMEPNYIRDPEYRIVIFAIIVFMYYENKIVNANKNNLLPTQIFEKILNIAHTVYRDSLIDAEKKRDSWNHVMFDYIKNKESVDNLLNFFRSEIPEAEAAFLNRFEFIDSNENLMKLDTNKALQREKRRLRHSRGTKFPDR